MNKYTAEERANHAMRRVMAVIGTEMGFKEAGNDKAYLEVIRADLQADLVMFHYALVNFFEKHPDCDPLLGMQLDNTYEGESA